MNKNKKNSIPFIFLFIIHSVLLGYSFYKSKNRKQLFTLLMSNIGFAYLFEYFVLNIFKAYTYKPKIFKKAFFDNIFGAILSQAIFVPFTAVFLSAYKRSWFRKILGGGYFWLVEIIFLNLGIYKHNWWKSIYTFILIPLYFKWSDLWANLLEKNNRLAQFMSLFLMILVTEANLLFVFVVIRKIRFGFGRYHSLNEHFILVPIHAISLALFTTFSFIKNNNFSSKLKGLIITIGIHTVLSKFKVLKNKIHPVDFLVIRFLMINLYGKFGDFVYRNEYLTTTTVEENVIKKMEK